MDLTKPTEKGSTGVVVSVAAGIAVVVAVVVVAVVVAAVVVAVVVAAVADVLVVAAVGAPGTSLVQVAATTPPPSVATTSFSCRC